MAKIIIIVIVATMIESVGVIILTRGLKQVQGWREHSISEIVRVAKSGVTNVNVIGGVALEAVFFGALLYMLATSEASFVFPLTSLVFIFTTLAAQFVLNEKVTVASWAGVLLITIGATLVGYGEASKEPEAPPPANSTPLSPQ
ncbi:MAG TPA: EamA family transporter [Verrucomicrobiae bacterium]|jgi:drug/metabolite transporter (DMT)-like permease|nr:EamA family transporter [Verrucomicrobiae bacterium]